MNYSSLLFFSTLGLITGFWHYSAKHWFDLEQPSGTEKKNSIMIHESDLSGGQSTEELVDEKELDEIENWLDNLERDLRNLS
jgi:hypothetical protein